MSLFFERAKKNNPLRGVIATSISVLYTELKSMVIEGELGMSSVVTYKGT